MIFNAILLCYILAGHRRRKVCILLGIKSVDVEIRDFDSEEEEVEFIIDNNATREKTAEQKSREAKDLKEVESVLALKRKSIGGKGGFKDVPVSAHLSIEKQNQEQEQGRSRDVVAQKVGLKSGREVDRAIRASTSIISLRSLDVQAILTDFSDRSLH